MSVLTLVATPDREVDFRDMPVWLIESLDADEGGGWRRRLVTFDVYGYAATVILDDAEGHFAYEFNLDEANRTIYKKRRSK